MKPPTRCLLVSLVLMHTAGVATAQPTAPSTAAAPTRASKPTPKPRRQQAAPAAPAPSAVPPSAAPAPSAVPPPVATNLVALPPAPDPSAALRTWAGAVEDTSLPVLLQHAMQHLPALAAARYDIAIAEAQMEIARAREDWQIAADASVQSNRAFFAGMAGRQTRLALTGSLTRPLATGGAVSINADTSVNDSAFDAFDARNWADSLTASITHPLMRGRGRAVVEINQRRAALERSAGVVAQGLVALNAVQTIVAAYWDLVLAETELDIAQSSLTLANERLRVTALAIAGGKLAPNEDLPILQGIATRQEEVLAAELAVVTRSIALRRAAGMEIHANKLALRVETTVPTPDFDTAAIGALLDRAVAQSPELARLAHATSATALDVEVAQNGLLPQLDAALTLGPTGTGTKAIDAFTGMFTDPGIVIGGTLTYRQSMAQRDVRGRLQSVAANREKITMNAADVRAQIASALTLGLGQIELARGRIELSQRTIALATRNIENEVARVTLGKSTNFDVLQRQDELKAAQLRRIRALIDGQKAIGSVMAITGEIMSHYGIAAPRPQ
ncbi:MAG: TolC family protein [Kofleriaceae bacterium]|nr:TolC family protein [Kofleriaceae bacterium]